MSPAVSKIRLLIAGLAMITYSVVFFLICIPLLPWRVLRIKACNGYGTIAGKTMIWATGAKPVFHRRDKINSQYPAVYVSNHSSTLDMWVGMWVCPVGGAGLAKREIVWVPGVGQLYLLSGHPLIDRSNRERAIKTMDAMARFIKKNNLSLWLWPEGTRSKDGKLQPFKKGFVHAALATGLPIVPIVLHNAAKIFPRGKIQFNPGPLDIEVLDAVDTAGWHVDTIDAHVEEVHGRFTAALEAGPPSAR